MQQQLGGRGDALHRQLHLRSSQRARSRSGVSVMAVASPRDDLRLGHEAVYVDRNKTTWDVLGLGQAMVRAAPPSACVASSWDRHAPPSSGAVRWERRGDSF